MESELDDQQILEKAIKKAIDGGWSKPNTLTFVSNKEFLVYLTQSSGIDLYWLKFKTRELMFDHDFARALWGEAQQNELGKSSATYMGVSIDLPRIGLKVEPTSAWKYHLQQMVIADDPIKYIGENI